MSEYRDLTADDIESLAVGAWILGTGGGRQSLPRIAEHAPIVYRRQAGQMRKGGVESARDFLRRAGVTHSRKGANVNESF